MVRTPASSFSAHSHNPALSETKKGKESDPNGRGSGIHTSGEELVEKRETRSEGSIGGRSSSGGAVGVVDDEGLVDGGVQIEAEEAGKL